MRNKITIPGFYLQSEPWLREQMKVMEWCVKNDTEYHIINPQYPMMPLGFIPVGNVGFVERFIGQHVIPDYDPPFLCEWYQRAHGICSHRIQGTWFYKPLDRYKRFDGFVGAFGSAYPHGPYWYSEVVTFTNEWRYYIANGECLTAAWYKGNDESESPPKLEVRVPKKWCGTIDMGRLDNGEIAIVECHHPFACGWYGEDTDIYVEWLTKGWQYMKGLK